MGNSSKPGPLVPGPRVAFDLVRHVDTGDPSIDDAGKVLGDLKVPVKDHGERSGGAFTVVTAQVHVPDLHRGEDDEDDKKKRAEEKARQAELLGDARGEQTEHFKEHFPAPDDTSPPKPNERVGRATRTRGG